MGIEDNRYEPTGLVDGLPISVQREMATDNGEPFRRVARTLKVPAQVLVNALESASTGVNPASETGFTPPEAA